MRISTFALVASSLLLVPAVATAAPLVIDGSTQTNKCPGGRVRDAGRACEYGGTQTFDYVDLKNGAVLYVKQFDGVDPRTTGNLLVKTIGLDPTGKFSIRVDRSSRVDAKGDGYRGRECDNGEAPATSPLAGGRGGCSTRDSGGGGGHLAAGGRGTKDSPVAYPAGWDEACGGGLDASGKACKPELAACYDNDGLPTVAGASYTHSPYDAAFGAAGGDKGCLGIPNFGNVRAGNGGGRVVLVAANAGQTGVLLVDGAVVASGDRGCASGNDAAGGGAGGSILLVADTLTLSATARVTAGGGLGGDAAPKCLPCSVNSDCVRGQTCQTFTDSRSGLVRNQCGPCSCTPCTSNAQCDAALGQTCKDLGGDVGKVCADASNQCGPTAEDDVIECLGTQNNGTCDSCGGGGGGGSVVVQARISKIDPSAELDARGGSGGVCPVCVGEAGGSVAPTIGDYVGEICDGKDNDFDGMVDEDLAPIQCSDGSLAPSCVNGVPVTSRTFCACPAATGSACDNGKLGACKLTGTLLCNDDHLGTTCSVAAQSGPAPTAETCNQVDDDCDGIVDVTADGIDVCVVDGGVNDANIPSVPVDAAVPADAGSEPAPDAGSKPAPVDDAEDGCSCHAGTRGGGVGALGFAGVALISLLGRRRRRR